MPHPQLIVDVITTKRDDPNAIYDNRRVNFNNSRTRDWLAKHMTWAFKTGHAVHIAAVPATDVRLVDLVMDGVTSREQAQRHGEQIQHRSRVIDDPYHASPAIGPGKQCFAPYKVVRTLDDGAIMVEEI